MSRSAIRGAGCAHTGPAVTIARSAARANLFMVLPPPPTGTAYSIHRLCLGKFPFAVKDLVARAIEAHHVGPALHDRDAIRNLAVASAELHRNDAIGVLFRGNAVQRVGIVLVLLQMAVGVIDGD